MSVSGTYIFFRILSWMGIYWLGKAIRKSFRKTKSTQLIKVNKNDKVESYEAKLPNSLESSVLAQMKYTYYQVMGQPFCIKTEKVLDFEIDCMVRNLQYKRIAKSNSVESLRTWSKLYVGPINIQTALN